MRFLYPWGLLALTLIPLLVLIHLLRVPGRLKVVSFLPLWEKVLPSSLAAHSTPRRRFDLLLILEALIVALLALALAQLAFRWTATTPNVAIVLDLSASMAARTDDGATRLDHARDHARRFLDQFDPDMPVTLVECRGLDHVTRTQLRIREALVTLDAVQSSNRSAAGDQLFERVVLPLVGDYDAIAFFTDALDPALAASHPSVVWAAVGTPCDNVGITRWASASLPDGRTQVFLTLLNASDAAKTGSVILEGTQRLAGERVTLAPRASANQVLEIPKGDAPITTRIELDDGPDGFALDDAVVAAPNRLNVVLYGKPSPALTRFFTKVFPQTVTLTELPEGSPLPAGNTTLLIVHAAAAPEADVATLVINPASDAGNLRVFDANSIVTPGDDTLMSSVDTRGLHPDPCWRLVVPETFRTLLWQHDEPIGIVRRAGPHKPYVVLGFEIEPGWSAQESFVVFMVNLLREASPGGDLDSPCIPQVQAATGDGEAAGGLLSASESLLSAQPPEAARTALALPETTQALIWQPITSIIAAILAVMLFLWWCWPR